MEIPRPSSVPSAAVDPAATNSPSSLKFMDSTPKTSQLVAAGSTAADGTEEGRGISIGVKVS
ncbi:MAG TPA: hypothetical protein VKC60_12050, partial [Opitutaceae bacterium]|nr:hypothetical protein [Opitutaceae bacterium]